MHFIYIGKLFPYVRQMPGKKNFKDSTPLCIAVFLLKKTYCGSARGGAFDPRHVIISFLSHYYFPQYFQSFYFWISIFLVILFFVYLLTCLPFISIRLDMMIHTSKSFPSSLINFGLLSFSQLRPRLICKVYAKAFMRLFHPLFT